MKKILFTAAAIFSFIYLNAQTAPAADSTGFKSRKLQLEEINLVSSYYVQEGNNAAVTGGIGTEKLNDVANIIDVKLTKYDKKYRKHSFIGELGVDHYTSASSDMVDMKANSSASSADTRIYPSVNWTMENEKKGFTIGAGISSSSEYDYQSYSANINFAKKTNDKSGEFTVKLQAFLDQVTLIQPIELRTGNAGRNGSQYATASRNTFVASLSYSQIINKSFQVEFLADVAQQQGYLSLPFHRVYFKDGTVHQENLPSKRFKLPLGVRANYFIGDKFIIKAYYRYYTDDWGMKSHTAEVETPLKITSFVSVSPFYRFYTQSGTDYFSTISQHTIADKYYVSNFDYSKFNSNFFGASIRFAPPNGVFSIQHFAMLELRYGHYARSTALNSDIISLNIKYK